MTILFQLASNQLDIWHDQSAHPESPLYNIGGTLILNGEINYKTLNEALQWLIDENDAFRLTISKQALNTQKLLEKLNFNLEFVDFSSNLSPEKDAQNWLDFNFKQPFSLNENDLLWHFALIKESEHRFYLMTKYHHLIADGWSTTVVIARLAEIYNAFVNNQTIEKKSSHRYFDFMEEEKQYLNSRAYQIDNEYWNKRLPVAPLALISRRYPSSSNDSLPKSNLHRFIIKRTLYNEINKFSSNYKSTSYHTILIALATYFARIYQREDIVIGVPSLNRSGARYKDVFGMFISLSPLILSIPHNANIDQIIKNCKSRLRELYRHHRFPLREISKRIKLLQHGRDTLFDIVLSYEKHEYSANYGNATICAKQQFSGVARYPLAVTICEFSDIDDVEIIFEGAENCFTAEDLSFLADRIALIIQQIISQPQNTVEQLNLLTAADEKIIFDSFNPKNTQADTLPSVVELFLQQVKNQPEHIAVEFQNLNLSYQQLDIASTQLAQYLLNQDINANDIIAICLPRCPEMIIGLLAILKTSAAYLPIPADIPDQRISNILQQSKARILLTQSNYQSRLSRLHSNLICIDDDQMLHTDIARQLTEINIKPENLAYVIFTSGSSGQAKGVMVEHRALSSRINWLQTLFKLTSEDRMAQTIQYYFDPSIIEIFLALSHGACLVLTPEDSYTPDNFAKFICDKKITSLAMLPSSVRMLLQGLKDRQKTTLRVACCGGERLEPDLARQFMQQTQATLYNVYGPTEATILASAWECRTDFSDKFLPIGKPAKNTEIYISDKHLNILPTNTLGEIIIAGNTLAKGYIQQAALTESVFPVCLSIQSRIYKTGDIGYLGYDGLLYFSGRVDRQVKISGYRIELGEIEAVLQAHDAVKIAAVTINIQEQQKYIYAYVETTAKDTDSLIEELSLLLRQQLPNYMQARKIIPLTRIKTCQTCKIDYTKLPPPNINPKSDTENLPRNRLETQIQAIWAKNLPHNKIGIYDNFFELGGDSLSAISLMIAIEKLTGTRHPLSFLLEHPNIAEQAKVLNKTTANIGHQIQISLSNHQNDSALFIAASGNGDTLRFSKLADALGDSCSVYMLQPPVIEDKVLSIHAIAQYYADIIMEHGDIQYYISGFSIGGITALETARILVEKGRVPQGIILLDSIYPRWPLQSPLLFRFIKFVITLFKLTKMKINNRRLDVMLNDPGIKTQLAALPKHKIQSIKLPVDLILTKGMWMFHPLLFSSWSRLFKNQIIRHSVNGLHGEMFQKPHLEELTEIIRKILATKKT